MTDNSAAHWGFIDKRDRCSDLEIWIGVEPCSSEALANNRVAELAAADPGHEYRASPFLDLPIWVSRGRGGPVIPRH